MPCVSFVPASSAEAYCTVFTLGSWRKDKYMAERVRLSSITVASRNNMGFHQQQFFQRSVIWDHNLDIDWKHGLMILEAHIPMNVFQLYQSQQRQTDGD